MAENLNIIQLKTFLWVAALGSFRKTAEKMNTTQPAISSRIAKLERILGVRLFDRETGNVQMSPEGIALRPYAETIINTAEKLKHVVQKTSTLSGRVNMGVTEYAVKTWLPEFMNIIHRDYPEIDLNLHVDNTEYLRQCLLSRQLDLAILAAPVTEGGLTSRPFVQVPHCWVAAISANLPPDQTHSIAELSRYPILTDRHTSHSHNEVIEYLSQAKVNSYRLIPSHTYSAAIELLQNGTAIALLPVPVVAQKIADGEFVKLSTIWTPSDLTFSAVYCSNTTSKLAESLINIAKPLH